MAQPTWQESEIGFATSSRRIARVSQFNFTCSPPTSKKLLDLALWWARVGYAITPGQPLTKRPIGKPFSSKNSRYAPSRDPARIHEWWTLYPNASILAAAGLHAFGPPYFVALDLDDASLYSALVGEEIPDTLEVDTPSGNKHFHFSVEKNATGMMRSQTLGFDLLAAANTTVPLPPTRVDTEKGNGSRTVGVYRLARATAPKPSHLWPWLDMQLHPTPPVTNRRVPATTNPKPFEVNWPLIEQYLEGGGSGASRSEDIWIAELLAARALGPDNTEARVQQIADLVMNSSLRKWDNRRRTYENDARRAIVLVDQGRIAVDHSNTRTAIHRLRERTRDLPPTLGSERTLEALYQAGLRQQSLAPVASATRLCIEAGIGHSHVADHLNELQAAHLVASAEVVPGSATTRKWVRRWRLTVPMAENQPEGRSANPPLIPVAPSHDALRGKPVFSTFRRLPVAGASPALALDQIVNLQPYVGARAVSKHLQLLTNGGVVERTDHRYAARTDWPQRLDALAREYGNTGTYQRLLNAWKARGDDHRAMLEQVEELLRNRVHESLLLPDDWFCRTEAGALVDPATGDVVASAEQAQDAVLQAAAWREARRQWQSGGRHTRFPTQARVRPALEMSKGQRVPDDARSTFQSQEFHFMQGAYAQHMSYELNLRSL
jgi:hypothetical protein